MVKKGHVREEASDRVEFHKNMIIVTATSTG